MARGAIYEARTAMMEKPAMADKLHGGPKTGDDEHDDDDDDDRSVGRRGYPR
jgi:hypothetical protein